MAETVSTNINDVATVYQIVSIVAFSLAGLCLAFAIFCFFKFNIIKIISDLTGRTAKKSIAKTRLANEKSGDKSFKPNNKAKERGKTTDKISDSEKLMNRKPDASSLSDESKATDILTEETDALPVEETVYDDMTFETEQTDILSEATELLVNVPSKHENVTPESFKTVQSIVIINTDEVI